MLKGIPVSEGIAIGPVLLYSYDMKHLQPYLIPFVDIDKEVQRFRTAVEKSKQQLKEIKKMVEAEKVNNRELAIFDAHILVLEDPMVIDETIRRICTEQKNAEYIFYDVIDKLAHRLERAKDEHISTRWIDLYDVAHRVITNLKESYHNLLEELQQKVIVVAYDLGPSDTAHMINGKVIAFATDRGGPTSHTAIMAKALEIPAVVGLDNVSTLCKNADTIIVDGVSGIVIINPTEQEIKEYEAKRREFEKKRALLLELRELPAETLDGHRIELLANVELPEEVTHIHTHGADGIGLYRTEFLYLDRESLPDEERQYEVYKKAVLTVAPKPVVFRTVDLGGDKFASTIPVPQELNPFLGVRAIRLCLEYPDVFRTQLRALLRASALGDVSVMFPMVSDLSEIRKAKEILQDVKAELTKEGKEFNPECKIGIMIEVPSAAMTADTLAREVDFFSIGTNDLIQYTLAVDRINEKVAHLYQPLHPSVLRMIKMTIDSAHRAGIWVSLCGEMAANPIIAVLLMGMGIDKLSMAGINIPEVKRVIRSVTFKEAQELADTILQQEDVNAIKQIVDTHLARLKNKS